MMMVGRRSRVAARGIAKAVAFFAGLACLWYSSLDFRLPPRALIAPVATSEVGGAEGELEVTCETVQDNVMTKAHSSITHWEKKATDGYIIRGFGHKASKFLNRTLAQFDQEAASVEPDVEAPCAKYRLQMEAELQQKLHSIFLVQRSIVEQALYQRLRKDLLNRMKRKKAELDVKQKLRLLHAALKDYDGQAKELQPFFVEDSERKRAEKRLSELQWGILDSPEGKELKQRWKMDKMRRMTPTKQGKGISVSLSPGMRLMFRPHGLGNLQLWSRRQVGPPHNPNEVAIGVFNDGRISDVYNRKANPPLIKFQPTVGVEMSLG